MKDCNHCERFNTTYCLKCPTYTAFQLKFSRRRSVKTVIVSDPILEAFPFEPQETDTALDRFNSLSPLSRLVLTARYLARLSVYETAERLGITPSKVKRISGEAIQELKKGAC